MQLRTTEEPHAPSLRPPASLVEFVILVGAVAAVIFAIGLVMVFVNSGSEHKPPLLDDPADTPEELIASEGEEYSLGSFEFTTSGRLAVGDEAVDNGLQIIEFDAVAVVDRGRVPFPSTWRWLSRHNERIRDAITSVTRSSTVHELNEPDASSLRGRMRARLNSLLGEGVVREVLFSHFRNFHLAQT